MPRLAGNANPLEVRRALSHESSCMDNTTRYEIIGEGQHRVLANDAIGGDKVPREKLV